MNSLPPSPFVMPVTWPFIRYPLDFVWHWATRSLLLVPAPMGDCSMSLTHMVGDPGSVPIAPRQFATEEEVVVARDDGLRRTFSPCLTGSELWGPRPAEIWDD